MLKKKSKSFVRKAVTVSAAALCLSAMGATSFTPARNYFVQDVLAAEQASEQEIAELRSLLRQLREKLDEVDAWPFSLGEHSRLQNEVWEGQRSSVLRGMKEMEKELGKSGVDKAKVKERLDHFRDILVYAKIELGSRKVWEYAQRQPNSELSKRAIKTFTFTSTDAYFSIEGDLLREHFERDIEPVIQEVEAALDPYLSDQKRYFPHVLKEITIQVGELPDARSMVTNADRMPEGTSYSFRDEIDSSEKGDVYTNLVVSYPDKSSFEEHISVHIIEEQEENRTKNHIQGESSAPESGGMMKEKNGGKGLATPSEPKKATPSVPDMPKKNEERKDSPNKRNRSGGGGSSKGGGSSRSRSGGGKTYARASVKDGWVKRSNAWYYQRGGKDVKGWLQDANKWYFMNEKGQMQTGWIQDKGKWYYMHTNGSMAYNQWVQNAGDGKWYYLKNAGDMAVNENIGMYRVDMQGAWIN